MNRRKALHHAKMLFDYHPGLFQSFSQADEILIYSLTIYKNTNHLPHDRKQEFEFRNINSIYQLNTFVSDVYVRYRQLNRQQLIERSLSEYKTAKNALDIATYILNKYYVKLNFPLRVYAPSKLNLRTMLNGNFIAKNFLNSPNRISKYIEKVILTRLGNKQLTNQEKELIMLAYEGALTVKGDLEIKLFLGCLNLSPDKMFDEFQKYYDDKLIPYREALNLPTTLTSTQRYRSILHYDFEV
ncbi:hypothetical protein AAEU31_07695 [Pseudoalteromonas sp. SSMSWG5]|uniref:hypothetical protein n=1 Tax=Pseudoalteromonas sp. SSMSWG5 TaxID=3139396 RepID=UPI003BAC2C78